MSQEFVGETDVDLKETPFAGYTPLDWALWYVKQYGGTDGEHHKIWVLDQVARILNGTPVIVTEAKWTNPCLSEF